MAIVKPAVQTANTQTVKQNVFQLPAEFKTSYRKVVKSGKAKKGDSASANSAKFQKMVFDAHGIEPFKLDSKENAKAFEPLVRELFDGYNFEFAGKVICREYDNGSSITATFNAIPVGGASDAAFQVNAKPIDMPSLDESATDEEIQAAQDSFEAMLNSGTNFELSVNYYAIAAQDSYGVSIQF